VSRAGTPQPDDRRREAPARPEPPPDPPPARAPEAPRRSALPPPDVAALERAWGTPRGIRGWLSSVDHKTIGKRYIVTALCFFALGGIEAFLMLLQLSRPENSFLNPDLYDQIFTVHGSTMMFLFAVPIMEGMGLYFVPLMIGTRNVAFPKLNAFGYWMYLGGGLFMYASFLLNAGPEAGWFAYTPLSGPQFSPGHRTDVWAQMITFTELSALIVAVELIVTIFKQRAPGMSLQRIPLFVWSILVTMFMIILAMPAVMLGSGVLLLDRSVGTQFFNPSEGGDHLLWQHLFWFFGHPEVYIIFIPALGMISAVVTAFARRRIFGYPAMVLSQITTAFMGFGLWVHHMFATGLPPLGNGFFTAASMIIALPTGVQIFCWIATLWGSRPRWEPPLAFIVAFFFVFILGGMTGLMLGSTALDIQLHDTFFVVAHLHYVLIGGSVFPLFGALHYWFPKITGRTLDRAMGFWTAALLFVGFNVTFFPQHLLGLRGMPRRVYTYLPGTGWGPLNALSSFGAVIIAASVVVFLANAVGSRKRAPAAADPWRGETLEWTTASPPPSYNFARIPVVTSRTPGWDVEKCEVGEVVGMREDIREVLVCRPLDGEPEHRERLPGPSLWPLILAIPATFGFIGSVFSPFYFVVGLVLAVPALVGWYWPQPARLRPGLEKAA